MIIERISEGIFDSNCYIVAQDNEGILIDAGVETEKIFRTINNLNVNIKQVVITHCHIDHIMYCSEIKNKTGADVYIHEIDSDDFTNPLNNGALLFGYEFTPVKPDKELKDGEIVVVGNMNLKIINTPGHTPGSICIKIGNNIFTGDTLFNMSIGRTDLYNGNYDDIIDSINNKIMCYDDSVIVYPGHGPSTTIGYERNNNPFL